MPSSPSLAPGLQVKYSPLLSPPQILMAMARVASLISGNPVLMAPPGPMSAQTALTTPLLLLMRASSYVSLLPTPTLRTSLKRSPPLLALSLPLMSGVT